MSIENYLDQTKVRETAETLKYISETCESVVRTECPFAELAKTFLSEYDLALKIQKATPDLREWFDSTKKILDCGCGGDKETKQKYKQKAEKVRHYDNSIWDEALSEIFIDSPTWQS